MATSLIVAAHPDDEILGCGATIAKLVNQGERVSVLVLCSLPRGDDKTYAIALASRLLGFEWNCHDLPDQAFDSIPLPVIVGTIEQEIAALQPQTVLTHWRHCLNRDHRLVAEAVSVAARPFAAPSVKRLLEFETPSASEWSDRRFEPTYFEDVTAYLQLKLDAMQRAYPSELRSYPHPRSLDALKARARCWGSEAGCIAAEAFEVRRWRA